MKNLSPMVLFLLTEHLEGLNILSKYYRDLLKAVSERDWTRADTIADSIYWALIDANLYHAALNWSAAWVKIQPGESSNTGGSQPSDERGGSSGGGHVVGPIAPAPCQEKGTGP
jgi:hypothetical protein